MYVYDLWLFTVQDTVPLFFFEKKMKVVGWWEGIPINRPNDLIRRIKESDVERAEWLLQ